MPHLVFSLAHLAQYLTAELHGDPTCQIMGIAPLDKAVQGQISFLNDPKYRPFLQNTQASAVILSPKEAAFYSGNSLVMANPYLGYAKTAALFVPESTIQPGIHPTAVIGKNCNIAPNARIAACCVIGDNVSIGEHSIVGPGCTIGNDSVVGKNCLLYANVTLYHAVKIGNRVVIHGGAVLGSDGFGMVNDKGIWHKIPQLGGVTVQNDVEIGANTTIDRGALEDTWIGEGVKLDNLIQIAHNVQIGAHTAIAAGTIIAGSTKIGRHCMFGGGVAINGHLEIVDQVILTAKTEIEASITKPGVYSSGMPAQPNLQWRKNIVRFFQLDNIVRRLKKLEKNSGIPTE